MPILFEVQPPTYIDVTDICNFARLDSKQKGEEVGRGDRKIWEVEKVPKVA